MSFISRRKKSWLCIKYFPHPEPYRITFLNMNLLLFRHTNLRKTISTLDTLLVIDQDYW